MNTQFWLILLSAIAPALILLAYILIRDRKCPEPFKMIALGVVYGISSVFLDFVILALPNDLGLLDFNAQSMGGAIANALFCAGLPEEAAKMLMLWLLIRKNPYFDEYMDGIVYAVCIGMGFAGTENVLYLLSNIDTWQTVAISRALLTIPEHFCLAVLMGYFFAIAFFNSNKRWYYALAYLVPMIFHTAYDACLFVNNIPLRDFSFVAFFIFILGFVFAIRFSRKAIRLHLATDDTKNIPIVQQEP